MNSVIRSCDLPGRLVNDKYSARTASRASPEHRVKVLLGFPFSDLIRQHTIRELLKDPETADLTMRLLNK